MTLISENCSSRFYCCLHGLNGCDDRAGAMSFFGSYSPSFSLGEHLLVSDEFYRIYFREWCPKYCNQFEPSSPKETASEREKRGTRKNSGGEFPSQPMPKVLPSLTGFANFSNLGAESGKHLDAAVCIKGVMF